MRPPNKDMGYTQRSQVQTMWKILQGKTNWTPKRSRECGTHTMLLPSLTMLRDCHTSHSSYSEGDHCPLSLNRLPAAHTFFWVIPQRPHLISPFSQWNAIGPGFSQKNLVHIRIQSKNSSRLNLFHKFCLRRNFFIKNLETVCLRLSVPLSKIGTRTGVSLSSIRKDRN